MSRVVYENTPATPAQEALRAAQALRPVSPDEEGIGVNALPNGVYGYTYSPGLPGAPLFAQRRFRSFELQRRVNGEVVIIGFVDDDAARQIASSAEELTIQLQPHPENGKDTLVQIPYSRIRNHKQYSAPNQMGLTVMLRPNVPAPV